MWRPTGRLGGRVVVYRAAPTWRFAACRWSVGAPATSQMDQETRRCRENDLIGGEVRPLTTSHTRVIILDPAPKQWLAEKLLIFRICVRTGSVLDVKRSGLTFMIGVSRMVNMAKVSFVVLICDRLIVWPSSMIFDVSGKNDRDKQSWWYDPFPTAKVHREFLIFIIFLCSFSLLSDQRKRELGKRKNRRCEQCWGLERVSETTLINSTFNLDLASFSSRYAKSGGGQAKGCVVAELMKLKNKELHKSIWRYLEIHSILEELDQLCSSLKFKSIAKVPKKHLFNM